MSVRPRFSRLMLRQDMAASHLGQSRLSNWFRYSRQLRRHQEPHVEELYGSGGTSASARVQLDSGRDLHNGEQLL
ncbi:hypothetical protein PMAYCL1PPCAC_10215, partial [Pristionchus mayeri]